MENFILTPDEKKFLLKLARTTIEQFIKYGKHIKIDDSNLSPNLKFKAGAFVTLHKNLKLRGCIGRFTANKALYKTVQDMAISAATQDSRFDNLSVDELDKLHIEISVLTPLKRISSIDEIEIGKHGIYIKKDFYSGTLLPQVATENNWSKEEFLGYCSKHKAGLEWNSWKNDDVQIFTYEAIVFSE